MVGHAGHDRCPWRARGSRSGSGRPRDPAADWSTASAELHTGVLGQVGGTPPRGRVLRPGGGGDAAVDRHPGGEARRRPRRRGAFVPTLEAPAARPRPTPPCPPSEASKRGLPGGSSSCPVARTAGRTRPPRRGPRTARRGEGRGSPWSRGSRPRPAGSRGRGGVGLVGRRPADVAAQEDHRRLVLDGHGPSQRRPRGAAPSPPRGRGRRASRAPSQRSATPSL